VQLVVDAAATVACRSAKLSPCAAGAARATIAVDRGSDANHVIARGGAEPA